LKDKGYETALCGVQHETSWNEKSKLGYEKILEDESYYKDVEGRHNATDRDLANGEQVADYLKENKNRPFFLSFGMVNTHREFPEIDQDRNPSYVMPPFPKMKCNLYDTGIGICLIIKYPGNRKVGEAVDSLVSQIDNYPTICDMLKLIKRKGFLH
jgi:N-sulfoglucosamine sulfohydrolase